MASLRFGAMIVGCLAALPAVGQQGYFRQYIEAEDCALTNLKVGRNELSSYIGTRFAYDMFAEPGSGTMTAPLAAELPPGKVSVFVRVYASDGEHESRAMTVRMGGAEASLAYPREQMDDNMNWLPLEVETVDPARHIEVEAASPMGGRIIIDSILVSNDPEDGTYFARGRTRLVERDQPPAEQTARPETEGNMLLNSGFEVAPTNG